MKAMVVMVMVSALGLGGGVFAADRGAAEPQKVVLASPSDELIPSDLGQESQRETKAAAEEDAEAAASDGGEAGQDEPETTAAAPPFVPTSDPEEDYLDQIG